MIQEKATRYIGNTNIILEDRSQKVNRHSISPKIVNLKCVVSTSTSTNAGTPFGLWLPFYRTYAS